MVQDDLAENVEWAVLNAQLPGQEAVSAGILLVDLASDKLFVKLLPELAGSSEYVAKFWRELAHDLVDRSEAVGGSEVLSWLGTTASHLIQLGPRHLVKAAAPEIELNTLYDRHVVHTSSVVTPGEQLLRRRAGR